MLVVVLDDVLVVVGATDVLDVVLDDVLVVVGATDVVVVDGGAAFSTLRMLSLPHVALLQVCHARISTSPYF
ncbi:MAG: hypothetical protein EBU67_10945 [Actinobacteria bacterium]|nr:hypothetical protein [Actinomycetota bacterium]